MTFDQPRGGHELIGAEPIVEAAFEQRSTPVQWPSARQSTDGANFGAACLTAASFRLIKGRTVSFCRASRRDITSESRTLAKTFGRPGRGVSRSQGSHGAGHPQAGAMLPCHLGPN